jgi:DNA-binding MarR family transcriptional regulator
VLQHIRELFRVSQEHFKRIEARCGVSGVQVWAVAELKARPGMTISELARALSVHLSTASNLLDRMEANRLVRRERGKDDQRIVRVYVTPEGEKMLRRAPEPAEGVIPDALDRMPVAALLRLDRDLEKLLQLARVRDRHAAMMPLAEP